MFFLFSLFTLAATTDGLYELHFRLCREANVLAHSVGDVALFFKLDFKEVAGDDDGSGMRLYMTDYLYCLAAAYL